jgi:hypothetical protein
LEGENIARNKLGRGCEQSLNFLLSFHLYLCRNLEVQHSESLRIKQRVEQIKDEKRGEE